MLKRIYVLSPTEKGRRQVRRRRQLIGDMVRVQSCIKAELQFFELEIAKPTGSWTKIYLSNLKRVKIGDKWE